MTALRLLIVDDHPVVRSGLKAILALRVLNSPSTCAAARRRWARVEPAYARVDIVSKASD